jgi:hypothetical protein
MERDGQKKRGSARMREFGYSLLQVWFDVNETEALEQLRREHGMTRATYLRYLLCKTSGIPFQER